MKLKKALYGTKQAARCWWKYLRSVMESLRFHGNEIKPYIYLFKRHSVFVIVWVHVDDGIVLSNSANALDSFKTKLKMKLKLNCSNHIYKLVGLNIGMGTGKLEISQPLLTKQLLDSYHRPIRDWFMTLPDSPIAHGQTVENYDPDQDDRQCATPRSTNAQPPPFENQPNNDQHAHITEHD
ncbi:hypothetical protein O181_087035 [Austropuccinia psidii MF-1]|uniref:Reverse transcriptase Ty1/copia-type domain-containing protein n=1 Tax=Austropuccinia psidii MF-1 TaxID=1389203 RepID=A0A9Q3INX7_9BASI|nr:hypothetical protein [Austropuccinia psidii MF-1]